MYMWQIIITDQLFSGSYVPVPTSLRSCSHESAFPFPRVCVPVPTGLRSRSHDNRHFVPVPTGEQVRNIGSAIHFVPIPQRCVPVPTEASVF
jgi:hypothetical protein